MKIVAIAKTIVQLELYWRLSDGGHQLVERNFRVMGWHLCSRK